MENLKFTQEIKDAWLTALKSGDYTQGADTLRYAEEGFKTKHCCLGVLAEIHPDLGINQSGGSCLFQGEVKHYEPFKIMLGEKNNEDLIDVNDESARYCADFSEVIPIIETLTVVEP